MLFEVIHSFDIQYVTTGWSKITTGSLMQSDELLRYDAELQMMWERRESARRFRATKKTNAKRFVEDDALFSIKSGAELAELTYARLKFA